ncbi:MAG: 3-keto-disaccharide hydrolase [Akkermansiaceae bacterium]
MKTIFCAVLALSAPLLGRAPELKPVPNPITDHSPEALTKAGFTNMIQGDSLDGWAIYGSKAEFSVMNGVVSGRARNLRGNSFLCTEQLYRDFIYTFQFRFESLDGNSGCMFRGLLNHKGRVNGYQCEHDPKGRAWTAGIYDEARRGWLFPKKSNQEHMAAFSKQGLRITKMDHWNTITIKAKGKHLQIWMNGELRTDFIDDGKEATVMGFFGLQVHGGKKCDVQWRNIFVKELSE